LFFDVCDFLKPRYILFENVAAFTIENKGVNMETAIAKLVRSSYQVRFGVLRAAAHGVPQNRQRLLISALWWAIHYKVVIFS
jgi:DNA (cytosine-5)-methyltransferase 1